MKWRPFEYKKESGLKVRFLIVFVYQAVTMQWANRSLKRKRGFPTME